MKNNFKAKKFFFILILVQIFFILSSRIVLVSASDEYKPYLHKPSVGNAPKLETYGAYQTQLFTGGGFYSYDLLVPSGVKGLQPALSLSYSSQAMLQRPGIEGAGWSLTNNYVKRDVNHTVDVISDDFFVLSINGNRLRLFYNGTNWNTEINPRQYRVQNLSNGAKQYWLITTMDGTQYRFGFNTDSLLDSNTGKSYDLKWSLDLIQDIHNNQINYRYRENPFTEDTGAVYLANITYNNDGLKVITFSYEGQVRSDRRLVYEQSNTLSESRRLRDITIFFNGSVVRRYRLEYTNLDSEASLSSIANISYIGSDNLSVLNTVKFEYSNTVSGFDNTTNKWIVPGTFAFSSKYSADNDFGVRLIDINNDGFADLIKAKSGETPTTKINNKVNGWTDSSTFLVPSSINMANGSGADQGGRFEDINNDGLVDILQAKTGGARSVYLNNGTGWFNATKNWSIPLDFVDSTSNDLGVMLLDLNGDGRVDILKAQESSTNLTYLNNGTGWKSANNWVAPDFFTTSTNNDNGLRIIDLNNDGLPDLIKGGTPGSAWFNNGTGWINHSEYAPNLNFTDYPGNRPDLGVRFMDLNGDGLVDIVQNFLSNISFLNQTCFAQLNITINCTLYNVTNATNTKLNNGSGWVAGAGWLSPERFTDQGFNIGRRISDVNGDGYADIIVAYQNTSFENKTYLRNASSIFLLQKVTNAYGGITQIRYKQATSSDNGGNLGFNIWVVENTSLNNSMGQGFNVSSSYSYVYAGGKFEYSSFEFRGFANVNETLPDKTLISHFYLQDTILKGREFRTNIYNNSLGSHIRDNLNLFSSSADGMVFLNWTSLQIYDGQTTPITTNTTFNYDYYGNVLNITNLGRIDITGDEKYEIYNYTYNTSTFVVSTPINYTLYDADGRSMVKQTLYFYDNQTSGVRLGDLTKVRNINNKGSNPETQFIYDSFGNVINQIDPLGNAAIFTYDSTGTFLTRQINALGHTTSSKYDLGTGNLQTESNDGFNKTITYDTFGRVEKEIISPDTISSPTKLYNYSFDGTAPERINITTKNTINNYSEQLFFYDGTANVVQVRSSYNGKQIVKNYFYDSKYRIKQEQNPYFETYSSTLNTPQQISTQSYTYDSLDRIVNITKQDNNSTSILFNKSTVTQFDENRNRIDYFIDVYNRIEKVAEYNGSDIFITNYTYRVDDILLNITDTKSNRFIFNYDSLGRRISYDDPNMEKWTYAFDANGNIINQTDGRNITTFISYDKLNRVVFKIAGKSNITFVYDKQINGTLSNISQSSDYFRVVYFTYTYDNRSRIITEKTFVCYREVNPGSDECEWINVSKDYDSQDRILNMYLPQTNLSYNYDSLGKIKKINGFLDSVNYNAFGKIDNRTYSNNLISDIDYDSLGRISQLQTDFIQNLSYSYDAVGNVKSINDTKGFRFYIMAYDSLNRLTLTNITDLTTNTTKKFTYVYDAIGNLLNIFSNNKNISYTYGTLAHAPVNLTINYSTSIILLTDCGVLNSSNTLYLLQNNVSSNNTCFNISADNITFDGQQYFVRYASVSSGHGIYNKGYNGTTIMNLALVLGNPDSVQSKGIFFENGRNHNITSNTIQAIDTTIPQNSEQDHGIELSIVINSYITNNRIFTDNSGGNGIFIRASSAFANSGNNRVLGNNITTDAVTSRGVYILASNGGDTDSSIISFNIINTTSTNSEGIRIERSAVPSTADDNYLDYNSIKSVSSIALYLDNSSSNFVNNSNLLSSGNADVLVQGSNNILLNTSYIDESVTGQLTRQWYFNVNVSNSTMPLSNANVTVTNSLGAIQFSELTDSQGRITQKILTAYTNNSGVTTYASPYAVNVTKAGYANYSNNSINLSTNLKLNVILSPKLNKISVNSCSILNESNTYYLLNQSLIVNGSCFNITAENVTLDLNGYTLGPAEGDINNIIERPSKGVTISANGNIVTNGSLVGFDTAIESTGNNGNFSKLIIDFANINGNFGSIYGIYFYGSNNKISYVSIVGGDNGGDYSGGGIVLEGSLNSIKHSTFQISPFMPTNPESLSLSSILLLGSSYATLENISIRSMPQYDLAYGINLGSVSNSIFKDISIKNTGVGIFLGGGGNMNNLFINVTLDNNIKSILYEDNGNNNSFIDAFINNTKGDAVTFFPLSIEYDYSPQEAFLIRTRILNTNSSNYDFNFYGSGGIESFPVIEDTLLRKYTLGNGPVIVRATSFGEIRFLELVSAIGSNFSSDFKIGNNSAYINSSKVGLNKSANITLYNGPGQNFANPHILRDGNFVCNTTTLPSCSNFTSLKAPTVVFNVSSWTNNYSIG